MDPFEPPGKELAGAKMPRFFDEVRLDDFKSRCEAAGP